MEKLAIVTGGTRGIGKAISLALKEKNYIVIANYQNNKEQADNFSRQTGIDTMSWDVSKLNECQNAVSEIEEKFGQNVSILINNAGITRDGMLHRSNEENWQDVINVNLNSCFNMCYSVISNMRQENFGRIVNISSVNAITGQVGQTNYTAAKAGIIGFTKSLALESAAKNVTVNALTPGYIDTDMLKKIPSEILDGVIKKVPVKRLGKPEEIARAVLFLIDDNSGFITGHTLAVNGGLNMV